MAVSIDTVYQKVLALANKEQRGYITPQEFNLFANQAQLEIFEQYFYDINQWSRQHGNDTEHSDMLSLLNEKINIFEIERDSTWTTGNMSTVPGSGTSMTIPPEIYRFGTVKVGGAQVEMLTSKEFDIVRASPLTAPTLKRPIGYMANAGYLNITLTKLTIAISASTFALPTTHDINLSYIKKPVKVEWGYFVINDKALHDTSLLKTTHFELHASEESELVYRILALGGIAIDKPQLTQSAVQLESVKVQQEKQ